MKKINLISLVLVLSMSISYAQKGKDGAKIITTANTVVNEYTSLTADVSSGGASLTVANSSLNSNNRFSGPLAKGDLIMIIQLQGATINGAPNDSTWGAITNYNTCGLYEFAEVSNVPNSTTINVGCSLKNNYSASGKSEVVRVPRFSSLTINNGGVLTADTWDGTKGGIAAVEVQNNTTINTGGSIDATGMGFRGGALNNVNGGATINHDFFSTDINQGGEKGESIAGYESDYTVYGGMYERGAPANGGGGGNSWNSAGGGGANAGNINAYNGDGNPDITTNASWVTAWNLEYNGFANSTSSGGGRGGYSVGFCCANPLTTGPDNSAWPTYDRSNTGGKGGRPLDYSTGRLFFGGGGGSPHMDNNNGSGGANGGGLVYVISYGTIGGSGNVISNGSDALDANCGSKAGDPPGGGGGGGTIVLNSTGAISGISITANGGKGGDQLITTGESEGAGAGGGGGYIALSNGAPATQALGGINGTTDAYFMTSFPPDGATIGGAGLANETISPITLSSLIVNAGPDTTICEGQSVALYSTGGDSSVNTYTWSPSTGLSNVNTTHPIASPAITTTYTLTVSNASCPGMDSVIITVVPVFKINPVADTSICPNASAPLNPTGSNSYTYLWSPATGLSCNNCTNPSAAPGTTTTYTVIASNQYCSDTAQSVVQVFPNPTLSVSDITACRGQLTTLSAVTNGTLSWSPATGLSCTVCDSPQVIPFVNATYQVTATEGDCIVSDSFTMTVVKADVFAGPDTTIYQGAAVTLRAFGGQQYSWSPPTGLSAIDISNPVATIAATTTFTVTGINAEGCSASGEVIIIVNNPCEIVILPNAFSPNGDGQNDVYKILNPFIDKLIVFSIYNRWGQLVFQTTDLNTGWDGSFQGLKEPVGAYVYYVKVLCKGNEVSYKGNVTLVR